MSDPTKEEIALADEILSESDGSVDTMRSRRAARLIHDFAETLRAERDRWQEEARRYAQNADYWRARLAKLEAAARDLLVRLDAREPHEISTDGLRAALADTGASPEPCPHCTKEAEGLREVGVTDPDILTVPARGTCGHEPEIEPTPQPLPLGHEFLGCTRTCNVCHHYAGHYSTGECGQPRAAHEGTSEPEK